MKYSFRERIGKFRETHIGSLANSILVVGLEDTDHSADLERKWLPPLAEVKGHDGARDRTDLVDCGRPPPRDATEQKYTHN